MKNVLVTGAGGFLGRRITQRLVQRGDHVRAFVRRHDRELAEWGVEQVIGDLRNQSQVIAACNGMESVFHVAAITGIAGKWEDFQATNVFGTGFILEGCVTHGVRRLIYTSSPSVTFEGKDQLNVDESAPYARKWLGHYSRSKAIAEQLVLCASAVPGTPTESHGLLTCALRPHLIWGPGDRQLTPRVLERARKGTLRRIGKGNNQIDMVYVENAAQAHLDAEAALQPGSAACGRAFFIGQGEPVRCWDRIDEILQLAGLPRVRRSIPLWGAWSIGAVLEFVYRLFAIAGEPPMTRFLALMLGRSHYYNIDQARQILGYAPHFSTAEGMQKLGEWLEHESLEKTRQGAAVHRSAGGESNSVLQNHVGKS